MKLTKSREIGDLSAPAEPLRRLDLDRRCGLDGDLEVGVEVGAGDEERDEGVCGRWDEEVGNVAEGRGEEMSPLGEYITSLGVMKYSLEGSSVMNWSNDSSGSIRP